MSGGQVLKGRGCLDRRLGSPGRNSSDLRSQMQVGEGVLAAVCKGRKRRPITDR